MEEITNNEFGERLRLLIFKTNHNQSSFGSKVGVSHTAIGKILKGDSKPRYSLIESILRSFPEVSKEWLLDGTGEMFSDAPLNTPADSYLQEHLKNLERQFTEMKEMFSHQIATKDKQIEYYQRQTEQLIGLLGKHSDVAEETQMLPLWEKIQARA